MNKAIVVCRETAAHPSSLWGTYPVPHARSVQRRTRPFPGAIPECWSKEGTIGSLARGSPRDPTPSSHQKGQGPVSSVQARLGPSPVHESPILSAPTGQGPWVFLVFSSPELSCPKEERKASQSLCAQFPSLPHTGLSGGGQCPRNCLERGGGAMSQRPPGPRSLHRKSLYEN